MTARVDPATIRRTDGPTEAEAQALRHAAARLRAEAIRLDQEADAVERVRTGEAGLLDDLVPVAVVAQRRAKSKEAIRQWARRRGLIVRVDGKLYIRACDLEPVTSPSH